MEEGDHSECPIELLACSEHHGGECLTEESMLADAIQMMLNDAGIFDEEDGGIELENMGLAKQTPQEPHVGIVWSIRDRLIFDSVPMHEAEANGEHWDHPRSHIDVWAHLQRHGKVPRESEYEEFPRGRVIYSSASATFTLLLDKCILDRKDLIDKIKAELHLPKKIKLSTDPHYRCFHCLYGDAEDDDSDFE
jgi:hypothetical protein